jgi:hypothetical protein
MNTKDEALELTQIDFGGDCDTPPEPWSAIWVAWNSEDGFSFWKHQNQAALWSAADSNEWPVQYAMQKAQPAEDCAAILYRDHNEKPWVHVIQKDLPSGTKLIAITKGQP